MARASQILQRKDREVAGTAQTAVSCKMSSVRPHGKWTEETEGSVPTSVSHSLHPEQLPHEETAGAEDRRWGTGQVVLGIRGFSALRDSEPGPP